MWHFYGCFLMVLFNIDSILSAFLVKKVIKMITEKEKDYLWQAMLEIKGNPMKHVYL